MSITHQQAIASIAICQKLTTTFCSIELLRFDETREVIYILAITFLEEEIEVIINVEGELDLENE
jgi:hypothetical protein